ALEEVREREIELIRYREFRHNSQKFLTLELPAETTKKRARMSKPRGGQNIRQISSQRDSRLPPPGGILTREYNGRYFEVKVLEDGFEFEGYHYNTVTAVAKKITGYRTINGFDFFGLNDKKKAKKNNQESYKRSTTRHSRASKSNNYRSIQTAKKASSKRDPRLPPSGEILTRKFKGRDFRVKVLKEGFEFEGQHYKTLTAVAKKITGYKTVSGFYFFNLQ
ncbi:MAG: DUF2924 domain-containing protein, partial [Alphaproteobacteria bacterium]